MAIKDIIKDIIKEIRINDFEVDTHAEEGQSKIERLLKKVLK